MKRPDADHIPPLMVVSYYTVDTPYVEEAARFTASCERHEIPYEIASKAAPGDWFDATRLKVEVIRDYRRELSGPIMWVDCDAVFHAKPDLGHLAKNYDISYHKFRNTEWLTGTLWLNDTPVVYDLLDRWCRYNKIQLSQGNRKGAGQRNLRRVIEVSLDLKLRTYYLPPKYCWIFDLSKRMYTGHDYGPTIIEHLQASRENRNPGAPPNASRQARIAEIDGTN